MDFEVQRCTRRCVVTDRTLRPGETICSVLVAEGAKVVRYDYGEEAWQGPPEGALGWWRSQIPRGDTKRIRWAPNDVMLDLFDQWSHASDRQDMCYVLTLLLVRRRVMRIEESVDGPGDRGVLTVYCPRRDTTYEVPCREPTEGRVAEIQAELGRLLQVGPG